MKYSNPCQANPKFSCEKCKLHEATQNLRVEICKARERKVKPRWNECRMAEISPLSHAAVASFREFMINKLPYIFSIFQQLRHFMKYILKINKDMPSAKGVLSRQKKPLCTKSVKLGISGECCPHVWCRVRVVGISFAGLF